MKKRFKEFVYYNKDSSGFPPCRMVWDPSTRDDPNLFFFIELEKPEPAIKPSGRHIFSCSVIVIQSVMCLDVFGDSDSHDEERAAGEYVDAQAHMLPVHNCFEETHDNNCPLPDHNVPNYVQENKAESAIKKRLLNYVHNDEVEPEELLDMIEWVKKYRSMELPSEQHDRK